MINPGPAYVARLDAAQQLEQAGIDSAAYDAAELLADVLGTSRGLLPMAPDLTPTQARHYAEHVRRRLRREPLQHILGFSGFLGVDLAVGPGVFIPRPETELLADHALRLIARLPSPRVIDLCSGSGAIPIAIGRKRRSAEVIAVELDPDAAGWLRRNVERLAPAVRVIEADAMSEQLPVEPGFDVLTCNPPYVPLRTEVSLEVSGHDPHAAVYGGDDGLDLIRPLVGAAARLLRPGGTALVEHDESHQDQVIELFEAGGFEQVAGHLDLTGRPRYLTAVRGRHRMGG